MPTLFSPKKCFTDNIITIEQKSSPFYLETNPRDTRVGWFLHFSNIRWLRYWLLRALFIAFMFPTWGWNFRFSLISCHVAGNFSMGMNIKLLGISYNTCFNTFFFFLPFLSFFDFSDTKPIMWFPSVCNLKINTKAFLREIKSQTMNYQKKTNKLFMCFYQYLILNYFNIWMKDIILSSESRFNTITVRKIDEHEMFMSRKIQTQQYTSD